MRLALSFTTMADAAYGVRAARVLAAPAHKKLSKCAGPAGATLSPLQAYRANLR